MNSDNSRTLRSYMFKSGDKHSAVNIIKSFLNSRSGGNTSSLKTNNSFDSETEKALTDFQKSKGLGSTGRMDIKTWLAIGAEMNPIQIELSSMADSTVHDLLQSGHRSKFPFRKVESRSLGYLPIHSSSANPFALPGSYNFTFLVYVSVFAPFDWFGPLNLSKGDGAGRRFGTNPLASYRLQCFSTVIAKPGNHDYTWKERRVITRVSPATKSYLWKPWNQDPAPVHSEGHLRREEFSMDSDRSESDEIEHYNDRLSYHFFGNDDAFASWGGNSWIASDIDIHPDISFKHKQDETDPQKVLLSLSGTVRGDQFPTVETFILDTRGNGVMLGVWQINEGDGPILTRNGEPGIPGDKKFRMIDIDLTVVVKNGFFTGVLKDGRTISLEEHNNIYTSLPPVKPYTFVKTK